MHAECQAGLQPHLGKHHLTVKHFHSCLKNSNEEQSSCTCTYLCIHKCACSCTLSKHTHVGAHRSADPAGHGQVTQSPAPRASQPQSVQLSARVR